MRHLAACFILLLTCGAGDLAAMPESGMWLTQNQQAVIEVTSCGVGLCGSIIGVSLDHPSDPPPVDHWGRPQCGDQIIRMMNQTPDGHWHGIIRDPRSGGVYNAQLWREGTKLRLRGYIGFAFLGETQTWLPYERPISGDCKFDRR